MMLRPSKHSHPDRTVIHVATLLLRRLKVCRVEEYDALKTVAKGRVSGGDVLFLPAMNLLYLLGLVEYRPKIDAFEYLGSNEAV
ncbi:MAG: ABC-three component system middle component 8 [Polyangiaceae bacterium]